MTATAKNFHLTATTYAGLEEVLANEIQAIGGTDLKIRRRAVLFKGNQELMYKANLHLRTALRILKPVARVEVHNERQLYMAMLNEIDWSRWLSEQDSFSIDAVVNSPHFNHSQYAMLKVKDAIVDQFRSKTRRRPSVIRENPDLRIHIHIATEKCTISLDSSNESLHKRGYRARQSKAPLSEVLSAGMILLSGWDGKVPLVDPMCGSGTIPIEAALIARNIAPGSFRENFGFVKWKDFDLDLWQRLRQEAKAAERPCEAYIVGSDYSPMAVQFAEENAEKAGVAGDIKFLRRRFEKAPVPDTPGVLITNPPYGERVAPGSDISAFYAAIGDKFKSHWAGWDCWLISGNRDAVKSVGLRPSKKLVLYNGPIECRFLKYEMFEGDLATKKAGE